MKSVVGRIVLAIVFFAAAAAAWTEARVTRRVAEARERLATLHYEADTLDESLPLWRRLPLPVSSAADDIARHQATTSYWLGRYQSLTDLTDGSGGSAVTDSELLFMAANAAFRASAPDAADRKAAVQRLDTVVQSYADVLRKDATHSDAAFNYELVSRMRDTLARAASARGGARDRKVPAAPEVTSVDLPSGPTVHGRPGGPPEGTDMSDFKTITPMRYDEREEQMDPGRGRELRRKG